MKFPGKRKSKHYFPVSERVRALSEFSLSADDLYAKKFAEKFGRYVIGIDQLLVDIEAHVTDSDLGRFQITKGQSSLIDEKLCSQIYEELKSGGKIVGEYAGGSVGNTLHNYCLLADNSALALGAINRSIQVGDYSFKYLCDTSSRVNLSYLMPCDRPMGRALCLVTPDGERTFAISKGCMNDLSADFIPEAVIKNAAQVLISAYLLRDTSTPIYQATMKAVELAKSYKIPVIMSLGTSSLVEEKREMIRDFLKNFVNMVAMNEQEAEALTGESESLKALDDVLGLVDMALLTVGPKGLYMGSYCDRAFLRETKAETKTEEGVVFNQFEYSRAMEKNDCEEPVRIYTHINPFLGGPGVIKNTNGAGDAALAAVIHDMAANTYHQSILPESSKHTARFLTYSSLSQVCKYANRVSYEVLLQNSPRLMRGLPEKEDALEESYWDR